MQGLLAGEGNKTIPTIVESWIEEGRAEQALLESVENGEWQPVPQMAEAIQRYQQYATAVVRGQQEVPIHSPNVGNPKSTIG